MTLKMEKLTRTLLITAVLATLPCSAGVAYSSPYQPLVGIVHLHSRASSGTLSLEELALRAEAQGIGVVILAENFELRFAYGPPSLPELFMVPKSFPSLTRSTVAGYLEEVEALNRRHTEIIFIPGIETVPHYYWSGSLLKNTLTMHDGQKNILIVGLKRPEDYQALPIQGNPGAERYGPRSLVRASPLFLVLAGLGLLFIKRERRYKIGGFRVTKRRRPWKAAASLLLIGGAWAAYNAPFTVAAYSIVDKEAGFTPHQELIDHVGRLGGVTIWSYPEAKDYHVFHLPVPGPWGKFTVKTDPHPEALVGTRDYTAFGALYQDSTTAERPGRAWDRVLEQYCRGQRQKPIWGLGELGFHGSDRKELTDVLTTFLVREPSAEEVLNALRSGRMYAAIPRGDTGLTVKDFSLRKGTQEAIVGETIGLAPGEQVGVHVALEGRQGASHPFEAVIVRDGKPWKELQGTTPFSTTIQDLPTPEGKCTYYRLWMERPHRLVTNPIFVFVQK